MERFLAVWCPDWPVTISGAPPDVPAAVVASGRVTACSAAARASGVATGQRRREAQAHCPGLVVLRSDPSREARLFEEVVRAVEAFCPEVEVHEPGRCALATRGPARYFGGEQALLATVGDAVERAGSQLGLHGSWWRAGVADGLFTAFLAAHQGMVVPARSSAAFLAPFPVEVLGIPSLSGVLTRLGIGTLGQLAALPGPLVEARFGPEGALALRRARGSGDRPARRGPRRPDLAARAELDPPAERSEAVAFAARGLAEELGGKLAGEGLACTGLQVTVETEHGERLARVWCHDGPLAPPAMVERVRWQLDAWLKGGGRGDGPPTGGITALRLAADETMPVGGQQLGLWGGVAESAGRATRVLARVQGMLGAGAVMVAEVGGGRSPSARVSVRPWGEAPSPGRDGPSPPLLLRGPGLLGGPGMGGRLVAGELPPWPGSVPSPSPALVFRPPVPVELLDADGMPVRVSSRGATSGAPAWVSEARGEQVGVVAWAGPWVADEHWWDPAARLRQARLQVVTAAGAAYLLNWRYGGGPANGLDGHGEWLMEGCYD
jgi:protein ImuB